MLSVHNVVSWCTENDVCVNRVSVYCDAHVIRVQCSAVAVCVALMYVCVCHQSVM